MIKLQKLFKKKNIKKNKFFASKIQLHHNSMKVTGGWDSSCTGEEGGLTTNLYTKAAIQNPSPLFQCGMKWT